MAAPSTLLSLLDPSIREALTWRSMAAAGIDEGHPAIMRLQRLLQLTADWEATQFKARLLDSARGQAKMARRRLERSPELAHYYFQRVETRTMLEAMGQSVEVIEQRLAMLEHPSRRKKRNKASPAAPQAPVVRALTPEEAESARVERIRALVQGGEPDLAAWCAERNEPVYAPRERRVEALKQRRDWHLHLREYKRAVQFVKNEELARSRQLAAIEAQLPTVPTADPAPVAMRGVDFQQLAPADKVLHDHLLLARAGVPIPRASRHPLGHLPLHRRPGLR